MLLYEQELSFRKISLKEIIRKLSQQENEINLEDNIIINYFGDRNKLKKIFNSQEKNTFKNTLLFINYKEIYIGGVNLLDINIREKFGLNKYSPNSFYLGQWKNNEKEGIGFLKVNETVEYMGNFSRNQINGYGMSFYRENELLYIGNYLEGKFEEGIYYNKKNDFLYKGKIINGKKNDDFCSFIELEKGRIFIGKALDDIFIKGYLGICENSEINEDECNDSKVMELTKIIYFDKSDFNDIKIIHYTSFTKEFYNKIQDIMGNIIQVNYNMKAQCENLIDYFQSFDSYVNDRDYIDYLIKINQIDNEESLENYFLRDFQDFCKKFDVNEKEYNSQNIIDIIQPPDIINI
jgi:hypothetical protein